MPIKKRRIITVDKINDTLKERGDRYGDFTDHAVITDGLLDVMMAAPKWKKLPPFMKQALRTIADKIARILNGDPHYTDNWHDIQGYAKLAEDRCDKTDPNQIDMLIEGNVIPCPTCNSEFGHTAGCSRDDT